MNNFTDLQSIQNFINESNKTNSNTDKLNVLKLYTENITVKKALQYTYDTFKQYGVTSENCKKNSQLVKYGYTNLFVLLEDLNNRWITGHTAISSVNGFVQANKSYEDLIFSIIDRNLKTRSTTSMINKVMPGLIPTFDVALANSYDEKMAKKIDLNNDTWYLSRKLDGCLSEDTLIEFEDGQFIKIKEVVDNKIKGKIKSYNIITDKIEFKHIKDWMVNLNDISEDNSEWFELTLENGKTLTLTGNHRVWLPELKCWRRTDELNGDEKLLTI
jgi:intein/homing endonuclease